MATSAVLECYVVSSKLILRWDCIPSETIIRNPAVEQHEYSISTTEETPNWLVCQAQMQLWWPRWPRLFWLKEDLLTHWTHCFGHILDWIGDDIPSDESGDKLCGVCMSCFIMFLPLSLDVGFGCRCLTAVCPLIYVAIQEKFMRSTWRVTATTSLNLCWVLMANIYHVGCLQTLHVMATSHSSRHVIEWMIFRFSQDEICWFPGGYQLIVGLCSPNSWTKVLRSSLGGDARTLLLVPWSHRFHPLSFHI